MASNGIQMLNPTLGRKCEKLRTVLIFFSLSFVKEPVLQAWNVNTWEGSLREACVMPQPESQLCSYEDSKLSEPARRSGSAGRDRGACWETLIPRATREACSRQTGGVLVDRPQCLTLSLSCSPLPRLTSDSRGIEKAQKWVGVVGPLRGDGYVDGDGNNKSAVALVVSGPTAHPLSRRLAASAKARCPWRGGGTCSTTGGEEISAVTKATLQGPSVRRK